jgi:hypothetical protein
VSIQEAVLLDITILGMCRGFQHSKLHYSPTVGKPEVANAHHFDVAGWGGRSTLFEDKTCTQKGMENGQVVGRTIRTQDLGCFGTFQKSITNGTKRERECVREEVYSNQGPQYNILGHQLQLSALVVMA